MGGWRRHESNEGSGAVACGSAPFEPFAAREPAAHAQDVVDAPDQVDLIAPQSRGKVLWWGDGLVLDRPCELHGQEGVPEQERASSGGEGALVSWVCSSAAGEAGRPTGSILDVRGS